jgi:WhiB family redox-sensing transcriptional regulator
MARSYQWLDDAACKGVDTELFFPPRDKDVYRSISDEAKSYCLGVVDPETGYDIPPCPVRKHCLWYAIDTDEQHGIWGGLSHRERNALVRKWRKQYKGSMTLEEFIFQYEKKGK